ncbi:MAG: zinc ribbon domain-containing protein [Pseudomonadota bacterium]
MPIYEYRCTSCGHEKEVLQKLSDPPLTECPACGKSTLGKLVSAGGFQLKGSGWYATDFKGGSKPKPKDGTQEAQDKSESKDKQEAQSKEQHAAKEDSKANKEPGPTTTTTTTKAPLPATTADKAD